jgi:hypothetical protein
MGDSIGYGIAGMGFIVSVISLIIIITFFVMASRLLSIKNTLKTLLDLELRKPENRVNITCENCPEVYSVSILRKGELINCPKCKHPNRVL